MANTTFGFEQLTKETPAWAKWMFRVFMLLSTAALFAIAGDPAFSDEFKIRAGVYLKCADMLIFGFSKMFGVNLPNTTGNDTSTTAGDGSGVV